MRIHHILFILITVETYRRLYHAAFMQMKEHPSESMASCKLVGGLSSNTFLGLLTTASISQAFLPMSTKVTIIGYERGNATLDSISEHIATNCRELYYQGIEAPDNEKFYFAFIGLEGDLPAQARMLHIVRHFSCSPNACCPWCLADDREAPYSDYRDTATWASTVGMKLPWRRPSPLTKIPGAETAVFACRDIFHLCHLGILRTGVASLLCYLCLQGHFPCSSGTGIPARMHEAYRQFRSFCKLNLKDTPHMKDFTRENMGWESLNEMPESSMSLACTKGCIL